MMISDCNHKTVSYAEWEDLMKAITVRGLDEAMSRELKAHAKREKKSVNQFILDVIRRSLGMVKEKKYTRQHNDLDHLFGAWTDEEFSAIEGAINKRRKIDSELWQ